MAVRECSNITKDIGPKLGSNTPGAAAAAQQDGRADSNDVGGVAVDCGGDKALKFANQPLVHSAPRTIFISATLVAAAITNNCIAIENPLLGGSRKKGPV